MSSLSCWICICNFFVHSCNTNYNIVDLRALKFVLIVRMYSFKLEGGEWFKEDFRKLFSLEWNSFEKTWFRIQFANQKNNRLFHRNNRLFIPVHKYKLKLKSSRDREIVHTGLYWFTLKPRATSNLSINHWGIH